jgi:hypothetical protein
MTADQVLVAQRPQRFKWWLAALTVSFLPWLVVTARFAVAGLGMSFDVIEAAMSAILYSIPVGIFSWLALTALSFARNSWRHGLLALLGVVPLGLIYFITILAFDR